jgi:pimeloyl-ACP methyl ester carboxylesterase
VFSISFGSLLALRAAAADGERRRIGRLLMFGGYRDWRAAMRFCATGELDGVRVGAHDPLNFPVLMMHVLEVVCPQEEGQRVLTQAWGRYVRATWGRPVMKAGGWRAVAQAVGEEVPSRWRDLFWMGCGLTPGGVALLEDAMTRAPWLEALDPTPYLAQVRCPVTLVHGAGDDVVPSRSLWALRDALAPHTQVEALLTGSYGHTGWGGGAAQALAEARTTARLLWRLSGR